jgi:hypothetical protein
MIRRDPRYPTMTPTQLLGEILHQELVDQDVEKSLNLKMGKSLASKLALLKWLKKSPRPLRARRKTLAMKGAWIKKPPLL